MTVLGIGIVVAAGVLCAIMDIKYDVGARSLYFLIGSLSTTACWILIIMSHIQGAI